MECAVSVSNAIIIFILCSAFDANVIWITEQASLIDIKLSDICVCK